MISNDTICYGSIKCQALKASDNLPCTNNAYYRENKKYLCGAHSDKEKRDTLPSLLVFPKAMSWRYFVRNY
jgi:hypothetical protein